MYNAPLLLRSARGIKTLASHAVLIAKHQEEDAALLKPCSRALYHMVLLDHVVLLAMLDAWLARANIDLGRLLGLGRLANRQESLADPFEH